MSLSIRSNLTGETYCENKLINTVCEIPLIRKMKLQKGLQFVRKMLKVAQYMESEANLLIGNQKRETYILLLIQGQIEFSFKTLNKQKAVESNAEIIKIKNNEHYMVDGSVFMIRFCENSRFFIIREKFIMELFEDLLSFPYLTRRLKMLRTNKIFDALERRVINKIAFDLEEVNLPIGANIFTEDFCSSSEQTIRYLYLIISGEVKLYKRSSSEKSCVCVLGKNQIFGAFDEYSKNVAVSTQQKMYMNKDYYGVVITESVDLYKIKVESLSKYVVPYIEYENKRLKWRESRLVSMKQTIQNTEKNASKSFNQKPISFIEKEYALRTFYGKGQQQIKKLKETCTNQESQCQNRQQYYGKKLDKILSLQKKRYGRKYDDVVLFPIKLDRRFQIRNRQSEPKPNYIETTKQSITLQGPNIRRATSNGKRVYTEPSHSHEPTMNNSLRNSRKLRL